MNKAITWIKSNPITLVSVIVLLLSLGFLAWVSMQGSALEAEMAKRQSVLNQIRSYLSRTVTIPSEQPDQPPEDISNVTINQVAIDQLQQLYGRMDEEYKRIFEIAIEHNRRNRTVLVEGLFPETEDPALPYLARQAYVESFRRMMEEYPDEATDSAQLPRLDAGLPPPMADVQNVAAQVEHDFRAAVAVGTQLRPEELEQLAAEKRSKALDVLLDRASNLHLYAQTDPTAPDFPFQIQPWAFTSAQPTPPQLWEGQLELWIQEDIAEAIAATNEADNDSVSVIDAPIKRLLNIDILPGYVGLHTRGALFPGTLAPRADGAYPPPLGGLTGDADRRLSDNFYVGPTGRVSNALYDVRHVRMQLLVDFQRLPAFINQLGLTNYMTVLKVDLKDVDEYQALQQGFIYGDDDVVQADIVLETIWLRDWTQTLMPKLVRQYLGIDEPTDLNVDPNAIEPGMGVPAGGYDPYGGGGTDPYSGPYNAP